ncbi:MAG: hypothetical protein AMXMBFR64_00130 [Myxococcales bacterium]
MGQAARVQRVSFDEYLTLADRSDVRHELVDGEVFAMTGATRRHATVVLNLAVRVRAALRGGRCTVYVNDVMVRTPTDDAFYPDVVVTCDERDTHPRWIRHPSVVVEVLSESTATYDRAQKFDSYRTLESLREYVLVDPDRIAVDVFRRADEGWTFEPLRDGDLVLSTLGVTISLHDLYEGLPDE